MICCFDAIFSTVWIILRSASSRWWLCWDVLSAKQWRLPRIVINKREFVSQWHIDQLVLQIKSLKAYFMANFCIWQGIPWEREVDEYSTEKRNNAWQHDFVFLEKRGRSGRNVEDDNIRTGKNILKKKSKVRTWKATGKDVDAAHFDSSRSHGEWLYFHKYFINTEDLEDVWREPGKMWKGRVQRKPATFLFRYIVAVWLHPLDSQLYVSFPWLTSAYLLSSALAYLNFFWHSILLIMIWSTKEYQLWFAGGRP